MSNLARNWSQIGVSGKERQGGAKPAEIVSWRRSEARSHTLDSEEFRHQVLGGVPRNRAQNEPRPAKCCEN